MLSLDDPRWAEFEGGYRVPYDASEALRALRDGEDVWDELWEELHHQGDLGIASYVAVPQLVQIAAEAAQRDWNFYGLLATIEVERHRKTNPPLPDWLAADYHAAWTRAALIAADDLRLHPDSDTLKTILSVLALSKGERKLGAMLWSQDGDEVDEWLEDRLGWSELYQ